MIAARPSPYAARMAPTVVEIHQGATLATWLQLGVTALAAAGTITAVIMSVHIARRATQERDDERKEIRRMQREAKIEDRASRQAVKVHATATYHPITAYGGGPDGEPHIDVWVTGDLHSDVGCTVTNDSDAPIRGVVVEIAGVYSGALDLIDAGESGTVKGTVYVGTSDAAQLPAPPAADVAFTDDAGDRWLLTAAGDVVLVHEREFRDGVELSKP